MAAVTGRAAAEWAQRAWCLLMAGLWSVLPPTVDAVSVTGAYTGRVLLVSMDGFRWDYLDTIGPLPNFERMARAGSRAPYVNNTFVTQTFPTHYTIATGT